MIKIRKNSIYGIFARNNEKQLDKAIKKFLKKVRKIEHERNRH